MYEIRNAVMERLAYATEYAEDIYTAIDRHALEAVFDSPDAIMLMGVSKILEAMLKEIELAERLLESVM